MRNQVNFGLLLALLFVFNPFVGLAQSDETEEAFSPIELIDSHVWDSHEFHITDWKGKPITLALPIILWTDNGLTVFSSSRFDHDNSGQTVVEVNGERFVRYEENIFYADKFDKVAFDEKSVLSKPFSYELRPLDFSITKTVFSMLLSLVLLLLIFMSAARPYKKNNKAPKGISGFIEPLILFVRDDIAKPQLGNNSDK